MFGWIGKVNQVVPQKGIYALDAECTHLTKTVESGGTGQWSLPHQATKNKNHILA
jgi:hypothetical protein